MSTTINISVLILTHRADERLVKCLASVQWAEEVLIFDYRSRANWQQLRRRFHFTVIPQAQSITDYSQTRNEALTHAHHEWVFFLDSDEQVEPSSVELIEQAIKKNYFDGLVIHRQDYFLNQPLQYGEAGHQELIRIGRRNSLHFEKPIHEEAVIDGRIGHTGITIRHDAHQSITEFFTDVVSYAQQQAQANVAQGQKVSIFQLIAWPLGKAGWNLIIKGGICDGWPGIMYVMMMSLHSFFVRVFMYELTR